MKALSVIGAAFLMACAAPAPGMAGEMPRGAAAGAGAQLSACDEPGPSARPKRPARKTVRHRRVRHAVPVAVAPPPYRPGYYNPALPHPYDTAYDRGMVLHFRSPPVSGLYRPEPGFPPTPQIVGVHYYRVQPAPGVVLQYDGLIGQYVQLARDDPAYLQLVPPPPPPPPVPFRGERG